MHAEIIAVGDEITSGQLLDTNTQWLSQRLEELGIRVLYHVTVGDTLDAMAGVFRLAFQRSDIVLATGGLGPTADDLTRDAISKAAGRPLVFDPEVLEEIRRRFARRNREMPERNATQAMFPDGGHMIPNPHGTAPGVDVTVTTEERTSRLFAVPGVPAEMREMWYGTIEGELRGMGAGQTIVRHHKINCFGVGESQVEAMLPDMIRRGRIPRVGITASDSTIILRITAEGTSEEACEAAIAPTVREIHQCLGDLVFGQDDERLEDVVTRMLLEQGRTLATVEWGTGGMVADWLGAASDSGRPYLGGVVLHDGDAAARFLQQPSADETLGEDEPSIKAMAKCVREMLAADVALAVGRFPDHDAEAEHPKRIYMALAMGDRTIVKTHTFAGHPALLKTLCAKRALNLARLTLLELSRE